MLEVGARVPPFRLSDERGEPRAFAELTGRKGLVLYAYPRDATAGCTVEAQEFTASLAAFRRRGWNVVGVSKDSVSSHQKFVAKHELGVPLLSDPDAGLLTALGAWGPKTTMGRAGLGITRSTFVFGRDGVLRKVYGRVKARGHAEQVLAELPDR